MRRAVSATCCGDHDIDFCRYAVVELDAELVLKLKERKELFARAYGTEVADGEER